MKPCVLLYHFQGTRRGRLLKSILVTMGVRIKNVERSEYRKPIGELAGLKEITGQGQDESYEGEGFTDEMLIMCGLTGSRIDQLLDSFRRQKLERIALKAVLTEHNKTWNSIQLHDELCREHEYMNNNNKKSENETKILKRIDF